VKVSAFGLKLKPWLSKELIPPAEGTKTAAVADSLDPSPPSWIWDDCILLSIAIDIEDQKEKEKPGELLAVGSSPREVTH
jgi:hypothetical protein